MPEISRIQDLPTPCFVLDEDGVTASVRGIREALARHWPNGVLSFSFKTNTLPCLNRLLAAQGVWAEVVSGDEFALATACGYPRGAFVCNGASKSDEFIRAAADSGSLLHLDSLSEVRRHLALADGRPTSFGVRINATEPDFEGEPLSGPLASRFGLSVRDGDLRTLAELLRQHPNVRLTSLHLHCNTRTRGLAGYRWLVRFFSRIVRDYSLTEVETLDIGGSFGHDFDRPGDGEGRWPSWNEYFAGIAEELTCAGFSPNRLRLVIEPGSSLVSGCMSYVTRVVGERTFNGRRVLQIDGSRIHVDPHFARASFRGAVTLVGRTPDEGAVPSAYLGGSTCLEKDRLETDGAAARANVGDLLVIEKTGAYTCGLSPVLFINRPPPVFVRKPDGCVESTSLYGWA